MAARWFGKRTRQAREIARQSADALPAGLWTKCQSCSEILFKKDLEKNLKVCPKCGYHYKLSAQERLRITVDEDTFEEFASDLRSANPLGFPEYEEKLAGDRAKTGLEDPMVVGRASIGGYPVVIGVTEFKFRGASMGSVYGEKVVRAVETAMAERRPLIMICTSGGARMQEGIISLMQMAKTSAAISKLAEEGLPYVAVLTDPTTAGVHASFASIGDVILAEPGALIGFAGERVAAQAGVINRPPNFQRAEFQLEHGMVDAVVPRKELKATLIKTLEFCCKEMSHAS